MSLSSVCQNKTIGVFFGGRSPEHDISIITGSFILSELKKAGVSVEPIYVGTNGEFYLGEEVSRLSFFKGNYKTLLSKLKKYSLSLSQSKQKLVFESPSFLSTKSINIDFVFPAFHGINGEDGTIQGLCEFFGVPYAGCGVYASSVAISKSRTKECFVNNSINTSRFVAMDEKNYRDRPEIFMKSIQEDLNYPVFVKPAKAGSSIGITKVDEQKDLENAIELAFSYDDEVLVEDGVPNIRDLTCAVMSDGEEIVISEIQEAIFEDGFLNYEDKYMKDGGTQLGGAENALQIPADISADQKQEIQNLSQQIFEAIGANGMARIDFLLDDKTGRIFANEINTLPGTLYHHLWEKSEIEMSDILSQMITHGMTRHSQADKMDIYFPSNVLNDANSMKLGYK